MYSALEQILCCSGVIQIPGAYPACTAVVVKEGFWHNESTHGAQVGETQGQSRRISCCLCQHQVAQDQTPDAKIRMYLVYFKYWTMNLMPLMVYPKVLLHPNFSIKGQDTPVGPRESRTPQVRGLPGLRFLVQAAALCLQHKQGAQHPQQLRVDRLQGSPRIGHLCRKAVRQSPPKGGHRWQGVPAPSMPLNSPTHSTLALTPSCIPMTVTLKY